MDAEVSSEIIRKREKLISVRRSGTIVAPKFRSVNC
jgi:hypothetical protein